MIKIIGICGYKQSGKDTVGEFLNIYYNFNRLSFADPMKEACGSLFGFNKEQLWGDKKEIVDEYWKITPREVLQKFGSEIFRDRLQEFYPDLEWVGKDFWVKRFIKDIKKYKKVVVADCRFPNECKAIKNEGGFVWRVVRDGYKGDGHQSEKALDNYNDYNKIFYNNGTIKQLYKQVENELKKIKNG